jgi:hypothetical protein
MFPNKDADHFVGCYQHGAWKMWDGKHSCPPLADLKLHQSRARKGGASDGSFGPSALCQLLNLKAQPSTTLITSCRLQVQVCLFVGCHIWQKACGT